MPKVLAYTPAWLARPNPGYDLFAPKTASGNWIPKKQEENPQNGPVGPRKTIATRGSEVFVAVGHEIRWADLVQLKEDSTASYRTLKVSIPLPITRLTISPCGDYLAVSTSHTVHVVSLPESALLDNDDKTPIKPKAFQVGPTAHVLEESPIATLLWHPLGYHGRCLITITREGVVRLWEVNRSDRSTFSEPTLSIDLSKLAHATNDQEDLSASKYGASKGFSFDSVYLEVASACFGDFPDQEGVHGWAPLTLWIAMTSGDVYALCPLLPSKWQLVDSVGATSFLQTLTTSIEINHEETQDDSDATPDDSDTAQKQLSWLADLTYQEPFQENSPYGESIKVFSRPKSVPAVPLLQGPFSIIPEVDDFELCDIIVHSLKTCSDATDEAAAEGLPTAVVCLLTDTCQIHVCLDLEGVVGRWLPSALDHESLIPHEHELVIVETIALTSDETSSFTQSITPDVHTDFSFFVSHASGVYYISLESWIGKIENELYEAQQEGSEFRLKRLLESATSQVEQCISRSKPSQDVAIEEVTSSVIIEDGNIGYLLLTTVNDEPQAVLLDAPEYGVPTEEDIAQYMDVGVPQRDVRPPWQPPKELWEEFDLNAFLQHETSARVRATMKEEIRLSPANLEVLLKAHRAFTAHTHRVQVGVADLYTNCARLQEEFKAQVWNTARLVPEIDAVTGNDEVQSESGSAAYGSARIEQRLERVKARQEELNARYENLRRRMGNAGGAELSDKEASLLEELQVMSDTLHAKEQEQALSSDPDGSEVAALERIHRLKELKQTMVERVKRSTKDGKEEQRPPASIKVPSHSRKQEIGEIELLLLPRVTAPVAAAKKTLKELGISIPPGSDC
ncbi:hypothetical protein BDV95DRAFT_631149 [Massariosphaeria phaeospora]|uniref:Nuclear pore complex protein An-Nup82 n=1 Tax=Massariosphaeria phaeospora TaxID=100035 RepID=A0A7C8MEC7_9PLEO|nr:hypothetical protein BDV95DRAFT_631149 [Massariosphaeria phaeospora]